MRFRRREQLAYLAMLGASGSLFAAENLPPFRIDPALLGRPLATVALADQTTLSLPAGDDAASSPATRPARSSKTLAPARRAANDASGASPSPRPVNPLLAPQPWEFQPLAPLYPDSAAGGQPPFPPLRPSRQLVPYARGSKDNEPRPTFVAADRIFGRTDVEMVAEGDVELRRLGSVLTTDRLVYNEENDEVDALGNVRLTQNEDVISGPRLHMRVEDNVGFFEQPSYMVKRTANEATTRQQVTTGSGKAERIDFEGENHYRLTKATYSTCGPTDPAWYARADSLTLDYEREVGEADNATLVFQNTPLLHSPWLTFSLNNQRKSGLLAPTIGTTSKSGLEVVVPYFWNIAPDMDATIAPRLMTKRGLGWNGEFRYLDDNYNGTLQGELLPNDLIKHDKRSSYSLQHNQNLGLGFTGSLNLNRVSDDTFFSDLSSRMSNIAQNNLVRQGVFAYASTWWNASVMAQSFQTLQDPALPTVAVPYRRLPQATLNANRADLPFGSAFAFTGEYVNFAHPTQVEGSRTTLYPQLSLPLQTTSTYVTPKIGLHTTTYHLEHQAAGVPDTLTRSVPIFSVDAGVAMERSVRMFGREQTQTLEPRLYYLKVPNRDQSQIPVFDTGLADFNFAQIFADNRYSGGDRISDAHQLTAGLVSRVLDKETGAELLRGTLGQRYYFKNQQVTLPGETPRTNNMADFLAALSGQVAPKVAVDSGLQYNPHENQIDRFAVSARYQPEFARVLSASYRYNRSQTSSLSDVRQIDVSGQWPLWGGWSSVGRYNYSLVDHRIVEAVGGLEYNGGCWVSRVVLQRIATATGDSSTAFFLQLELNGFSNIGSNPMDLLKRSVPGYGRINQPAADPVFANY